MFEGGIMGMGVRIRGGLSKRIPGSVLRGMINLALCSRTAMVQSAQHMEVNALIVLWFAQKTEPLVSSIFQPSNHDIPHLENPVKITQNACLVATPGPVGSGVAST